MVAITIPSEYGYVIGVAASSVLFVTSLGFKVGSARRKAQVPYPSSEEDRAKHIFNCVQRAHQNTLEGYPAFLALLFAGGVEHPVIAASAGVVFLAGRYFYAKGYSSGDVKKRAQGNFGLLGLLTLLGLTGKFAVNLVLSK
ncbi:hypothetical protein BC829DRAFT_378847 [Chytridium lagenaria]|nr:hypothetical protein BC829DRAFT_378847 [Chytridium lagenaria]